MRIDCPHCGERNASEFLYKGDASVKRPDAPDASAFHDFVYVRENPAGFMREFWFHAGGCQTWLVVSRHTVTHEIQGVELASAAALDQRRSA